MIRVLLSLSLVVLAIPALSEPVSVRSGAHEGYSRVVLELSDPVNWSYRQDGMTVALSFDRPGLEFDFSRVYDRIGRERIADIAVDAGDVVIRLNPGCACDVDLFELRAGLLVIDAREQGVAPARPDLLVAAAAPATPETVPMSPGPAIARPELPVYGAFAADATRAEPAPRAPVVTPALAANQSTRDAVAAMQELLVRQLARAAAQGLIDAEIPFDPVDAAPIHIAPQATDTTREEATNQLDAKTSIDRDLGQIPLVAVTDLRRPCLRDDLVTMSAWGVDAAFAPAIGAGRRGLYGEFDTLDPQAARKLAKSYLYYGFGAEASAILNLSGARTDDDHVLQQVARILDETPVADPTLFRDQIGCASAAAMWAALALPALPPGAIMNHEAIILSFSDLPAHARAHLGPRLVKKFIDAGDLAVAAHLRQTITRALGSDAPDLLDATLLQARGDTRAAEDAYAALASEHSTDAPKALIALFDHRWAEGQALSAEQIATAQALSFEHRGTDTGRSLRRAAILSLARNGAFDAAFQGISQRTEGASEPLREAVFLELLAHGDDAQFLRHVLSTLADVRALSGESRLDIADRLIGLGFPAQATTLLDPNEAAGSDRVRFLQARIALADGASANAMDLLAGQSGTPAARLRADALSALHQWHRAAIEYRNAGDAEDAARAAWHAGDWGRLGAAAPAAQSDVAAYLSAPAPVESGFTPSLRHAEQQLSRAADLRDLLSRLLPAGAG